jgi:2-aminoadipate transaminase
LYVVANHGNPDGSRLDDATNRRLAALADRWGFWIIEDDPYRELYFDDAASEADVRPMRADDAAGRVIYLSSFSKTLAPGYRVAWIDAPPAIAAKLEIAKQAEDLCTGGFDQRMVYESIRRGVLQRHLPQLRAHYKAKHDVMVSALHEHCGTSVSWPAPRGGFFLWVTLPEGIDADQMLARAVQHGVIYVAGEAFFVNGTGKNIFRLSFSQPSHDRIRDGVARLAATLKEELSLTATAASGSAPSGRAGR